MQAFPCCYGMTLACVLTLPHAEYSLPLMLTVCCLPCAGPGIQDPRSCSPSKQPASSNEAAFCPSPSSSGCTACSAAASCASCREAAIFPIPSSSRCTAGSAAASCASSPCQSQAPQLDSSCGAQEPCWPSCSVADLQQAQVSLLSC